MHYTDFIAKKLPGNLMFGFADLLLNLSPKNMIRIMDLLKPLARNEWQAKGFDNIKELILQNHGCVGAAQRFSRQLSRETKRRVFDNFVVKGLLEGYDKRYAFFEKYGFGPPPVLAISPTSRCNLHCFGCYSAGHDEGTELTFEEIDRLLTEAKEIGTYLVMLTGGEPFMKKDMIFKLIEKHTDIAFQVYTNSLLLTREDLARIVKAANTGLAISVEGLEAETDNRRGKGSWVRIMENLQEIKRLGGIGAFSVTGTSQNLEEILSEKFMQTMIDAGCLYGWYLMYVPVGTRAVPELMPSPAQRLYLVKQVEELRRRFPILLGMFWNDGNILEGCMSPKKYIHINSRGDAEACVFMHFSTHNIREHTYLEILRSPYFQKLRDRQPYNGDPRRPCPVTDNPHIFRDILRETKPRPTEPEAEKILTDFAPWFDRYAEEYKQLLDKENAEAACGGGCGCHSQDKA